MQEPQSCSFHVLLAPEPLRRARLGCIRLQVPYPQLPTPPHAVSEGAVFSEVVLFIVWSCNPSMEHSFNLPGHK